MQQLLSTWYMRQPTTHAAAGYAGTILGRDADQDLFYTDERTRQAFKNWVRTITR